MIRIKEDREAPKHVAHEPERAHREAPELGRTMESKVESKATGFDRTSYQREYMRRWRAKREADGKAT